MESRNDIYPDPMNVNTVAQDATEELVRELQIKGFFENWDISDGNYYQALCDMYDDGGLEMAFKTTVSTTIKHDFVADIILGLDIKKAARKCAIDYIEADKIFWEWE